MPSDIVLYMGPGSCSRVTMTALEEIGLSYEDRALNLADGQQQKPEYLALNRKGKVPALVFGGTTMTENAAILSFLDRTYPGGVAATAQRRPGNGKPGLERPDLVFQHVASGSPANTCAAQADRRGRGGRKGGRDEQVRQELRLHL